MSELFIIYENCFPLLVMTSGKYKMIETKKMAPFAPLNFPYQNCMRTLLFIVLMSLMLAQKTSSNYNFHGKSRKHIDQH